MTARAAVHLAFGLSLIGTGLYYLRIAQERHVALGVHGTMAQNVLHVREGSEAARAGIQVGDRLANPDRSFLVGFLGDEPTYSFKTYRGPDTLNVTLNLRKTATLRQRLADVPPDMRLAVFVGLLAMLLGWWVFARNPDDRSIIPFALWSAAAAPFWAGVTWSAYWSFEMWTVNTLWTIPAEAALQGFSIHWLLIFPRRLVSRRVVVLWYAVVIAGVVALIVVAMAIEDKPVDLMAWRGLLVAGLAITLCFVQLRAAASLKTKRQASWVLLGILGFSLVSFFLWDAPHLAGVTLPFGDASAEMIAAISYLAIPIGIAVAITREGLFHIDRFITRGMAVGATLLLLFFLYVGAAYATATLTGIPDRASLPVFWGFAIACGIAVLARPMHTGLEAVLDRVFSRGRQQYENALREFEERAAVVAHRRDLERLTCRSIAAGLRVGSCTIKSEPQEEILVAAGALSADSYAGRTVISDDLPAGVHMCYPIRVANHYFGTAEIGPKQNNLRFSDEDLLFLERLSLRCADQSARMELYDQALRRELDFAQTRLRIAADLHDDIGSNLSGIALMTETAADSSDGRDRLLEISRFARSMVDSLRDIVWSIDPDSDSPEQLINRMKDASSTILAGIKHSVETRGEFLESASPVFQRNVFLIFKEAIHNVARHSKASTVNIEIESMGGTFTLSITDDGVGFDTGVQSNGLGRKSMARRAERIGGRLSVDSTPGTGTTIRLTAKMA